MVIVNERGENTHSKGEPVKIPLLPDNVGKTSVNDIGTDWVVKKCAFGWALKGFLWVLSLFENVAA